MKLRNLITFRDDLFFEGAVQADWFYNKEKADKVTESFVFHGPKYFKNNDNFNSKNLIDTASLTKKIYYNLYSEEKINPFMLGIAGYGSGKSHLSIALAKLFTNNVNDELINKKLLKNLELADSEISKEIDLKDTQNLVLVINGMKDFNLNYEILKALKKSLELNNIPQDFLENLSQAYSIAKKFIDFNFDKNEDEYFLEFSDKKINKNELKEYILKNLDTDEEVYNKVNKIYKNNTGHDIKWDEGVSAGKILEIAEEYLCYKNGFFNKVILIFDEFGRYLEYASAFPQKAGDSSLQQIFEAIQNKEGNIIFLGFIQSDIKTYLSRVDKTSNISRYIGRFDISEKFYLSSNLETIFANLIEKNDKSTFKHYIENNINSNKNKYIDFHKNLLQWIPQTSNKDIWKNFDIFKRIILEGVYPFHPLSTYMLSSMSDWLQNRSSITLLNKEIKKRENFEINEIDDLKMIYPAEILEGDLFEEIYNAESEGRQRTSYSIQYVNIINKIQDKINKSEVLTLNSILISKILKVNSISKLDTINILTELSGLDSTIINNSLEILETEYGVIQFDESANVFDFIIDSVGLGEFKSFLKREINRIDFDYKSFENPVIIDKFNISTPLKTSFAEIKNIVSNEWNFRQYFFIANHIDSINFKKIKNDITDMTLNSSRGAVIWLYINNDTDTCILEKIQNNYFDIFEDYPVEILLLNDIDDTLKNKLNTFQALVEIKKDNNKYKRYEKFIIPLEDKILDEIEDSFRSLKLKKERLTKTSVEFIESTLNEFLTNILIKKYPHILAFPFDGFSNKQPSTAKKCFVEISKLLLSSKNYSDIEVRSTEVKNRFKSVLMTTWGIIEKNYTIKYPTNEILKIYFNYFDNLLNNNEFNIKKLYEKFKRPPYGINDYSFTLMIISYFANKFDEISLSIKSGKQLSLDKWRDEILSDRDIILNKILSTDITLIDITDIEKKFSLLCQDILNNSDLSKVESLQKRLIDFTNILQIPENKKYEFMLAEEKISNGLKLKEKYLNDIRTINSEIDRAKHDINIGAVLKILAVNIENFEPDELHDYVYPKQDLLNQKNRALELIETKGEEWINKVYCSEPGKLDAFQNRTSNQSRQLFKLGYSDLANKLRTRADKFICNLNLVKELNDTEKNIQTFLKSSTISKETSYKELKFLQKKAKNLKLLLKKNENIIEELEATYIKMIIEKENNIIKYLNDIEKKIEEIYDINDNLDSYLKAEKILTLISTLLSQGLDETQGQELREIAAFINKNLNGINEMRKIDKLEEVETFKEALLLTSNNEDLSVDISEVINNEYLIIKNNFINKNNEWKKQFINININDLNIQNVKLLIKEIDNYPRYIFKKTLEEVNVVYNALNNILSKNKLEFIIEKYLELNDIERNQFKEKILSKGETWK